MVTLKNDIQIRAKVIWSVDGLSFESFQEWYNRPGFNPSILKQNGDWYLLEDGMTPLELMIKEGFNEEAIKILKENQQQNIENNDLKNKINELKCKEYLLERKLREEKEKRSGCQIS